MKKAFFSRPMTEDAILGKIAEGLLQVVHKQAKPIIRQILLIANANGFPVEFLQYIFWLLVENQRNWPPSLNAAQKDALVLLREILLQSGEMPSYRSGLQVPPGDAEFSVDSTLDDLSIWMLKSAAPFAKEYMRLLKKYAKAIRKANPDVPKRMGMVYLRAALEQAIRYHPQNFEGGQLLYRAFNTFMH